jgi:predicted RNA-binding protein YlqC (UPF0109 family)
MAGRRRRMITAIRLWVVNVSDQKREDVGIEN